MSSETAKECKICGDKRTLDRCHLFPARIIKWMIGIDFNRPKALNYQGDHIIILCKNHHWAYDHFLLSKDEMDKIRWDVAREIEKFTNIVKKQANMGIMRDEIVIAFTKWSDRFDKYVMDNYGNTQTTKVN